MFKKLLNVGKGHSTDRLQQQQLQQPLQKSLFQLNEIRSYGFSQLCSLGYSSTLSLLAVGSKNGLLRVLGTPSVEFSYQLDQSSAIRQIEFIDCREPTTPATSNKKQKQQQQQQQQQQEAQSKGATAKLVVLTENGLLHLFELKTVKPLHYSDNTTQTDAANLAKDCCRQQDSQVSPQQQVDAPEYTKLEYVGILDHFTVKPDNDDRSKRVTTLEISSNGQQVFVGTESGNLYLVPIDKFDQVDEFSKKSSVEQANNCLGVLRETGIRPILDDDKLDTINDETKHKNAEENETTAMNLTDEPQIGQAEVEEPFDIIKFEEDVAPQLGDDIKQKKQGAIESIKKHPSSNDKLLISYHRGLSVIYDVKGKQVNKYFYHNQILESSCFSGNQSGDQFFTSHNDGSYIKWDTRKGSQAKADDDFIGQLYGPYPCKPTPKIQACTGLINDQPEDLIVFSGGMPRATYDDKNPVTIVRSDSDGKDAIKVVLDLTSKVLDFVVITRPRGSLGTGAKTTTGGGGGKKNKNKQQQQQQQQRNQHIAVALAILAEEEFVVIDLLNSESYLEFPLPYLNCVQPSAITCNQHYSDISDDLYEQLLTFNRQHVKEKLSQNDWPILGGKVVNAPDVKSRDILLTGHEDGSVNMWDVSDLSMRHLLHVPTNKLFTTEDDELVPIDGLNLQDQDSESPKDKQDSSWPPLKRVGKFDPYSDDTRLAIRKISLCAQSGTLLIAGTGGQVLVCELKNEPSELEALVPDEVTIVSDHRFTWKGREKLNPRAGAHKFDPGYQLVSYVQLNPPAAATSTDLRSDWNLFAVGSSYGFLLYDYKSKHSVVNRCTLNVQDFAIVSGDAGAMSRKKSFRKSLRESFRRLRRGRSQRNQPVTAAVASPSSDSLGADQQSGLRKPNSRMTHLGVRTLTTTSTDTAQQAAVAHRNLLSGERQVEQKVELSSIVKCITLTSAVITNNLSLFKPSLWVGTNSGQVLVYAIDLAVKQSGENSVSGTTSDDHAQESSTSCSETPQTVARLTKEIQLKHKAPIVAIFTSPEAPPSVSAFAGASQSTDSAKSTPEKNAGELFPAGSEQKTRTSESETTEQSSEAPQVQVAHVDKSPAKTGQKEQPQQQPRVLICSEEQFKVFNLPNLKPFCKFKLTAHEGLRAKKISITQFLKPSQTRNGNPLINAKLQSVTRLNSSKSLQSFATQTSPPASPVPPAETVAGQASGVQSDEGQQNSANGASSKPPGGKQAESNNNSLLAPNNNSSTQKQQQEKELLNAKFGAKANPSPAASSSSAADKCTPSVDEEADGAIFEPYMVCMSNQGDCAIYSVPDLKRQAQIQVCKREDVNGITSAMLTNYGEGYYLKTSSYFLRFSISSQRVLRVLSVV